MSSAGSWIFSRSVCSASLGHQSCQIAGTSLLLNEVQSSLHLPLCSLSLEGCFKVRKNNSIYVLTSRSRRSKVCWQGNGFPNQTHVYDFSRTFINLCHLWQNGFKLRVDFALQWSLQCCPREMRRGNASKNLPR